MRHRATSCHLCATTGDAALCATAPPAPPPLGVAGGGGALSGGLTVVETATLHDGEPVLAWTWSEPIDFGLQPSGAVEVQGLPAAHRREPHKTINRNITGVGA